MRRVITCCLLAIAMANGKARLAIAEPKPVRSPVAPAAHLAPVVTPEEANRPPEPFPLPPGTPTAEELYRQTVDDARRKSWGCVNCHQGVTDMHDLPTVKLGCTDCHGGDPNSAIKEVAHVRPCVPQGWPTSANPVRSYTLLNHESPEFIRFVNPGD